MTNCGKKLCMTSPILPTDNKLSCQRVAGSTYAVDAVCQRYYLPVIAFCKYKIIVCLMAGIVVCGIQCSGVYMFESQLKNSPTDIKV